MLCFTFFVWIPTSPSFCAPVKVAFEIPMNKASGGDGISVELFQILKNDAVKVLHSSPELVFWKKGLNELKHFYLG